jgi:hypothetical protein
MNSGASEQLVKEAAAVVYGCDIVAIRALLDW